MAAIAVRRAGRSVVIVEPSRWVGGILGAGLKPLQDCPNHAATGGMTRELLPLLGQPSGRTERLPNDRIPVAKLRADFLGLLERNNIPVLYEYRISDCVRESGGVAEAVFDLAPFDSLGCPPERAQCEKALRVKASVFIDASYEGDLMALSGIGFRIGRESKAAHGEELGGVCEPVHVTPISPFVEPGNPASGLIKWIDPDHGKAIGSSDEYTQAYNFRFYLTSDPTHRALIEPPETYDPMDFEIVGRYAEFLKSESRTEVEWLTRLRQIFPGWRNDGEYNFQREALITNAPVGVSHHFAKADFPARARYWKLHQDYLRGLHRFMSTDPRIPEILRTEISALGLDLRHHPDTAGWPHQLYIRVARRMEGRYTLTAHDVYNEASIEDPVCLAQYGIDVYPCRRIWLERVGAIFVALEGWMFVGGEKGPTQIPYPIPYRSLTPRKEECSNVLVPVCFSATHLAYASARMEPAFMMCGEAVGIAACRALVERVAVQDIDPEAFQAALDRAGMVRRWNERMAD